MALIRKKNTITREIYIIKVLQVFAAVAVSVFMFLSCSTKSDSVYTLTTSTDPAASGIVTPSQGGFDKGSEVEITASANENMVFSGWRGDFVGSENPAVITMNSDKNIIAFFVEKQYSLSIQIEGEGTVTERILREKSTEYGQGTFVELTAIPAEGWRLAEWKGDLSGSENPKQFVINSPKEVTAVFTEESEESTFNLAVNVDGEGSVSIDPEQDEYESGTTVELTAVPSDGWEFVEWTGDINSSQASVETTMDSNKEVTAVFAEEPEEPEEIRYNLAVNVDGEGSVSIDPEQDEYESGTTVELTAVPSDGWEFVEWTGDINSSRTSVESTMDSNKEVTAVFAEEPEEPEEIRYNLAVNVDGEGSVSIDPEQDEYEPGTTVELTAVPSDGWEFVEWTGDVNSSQASVETTMDSNKEVTAVFAEEPEEPEEIRYNLAVNVDGEGSVSIDPEQDEYESGTTVELTATPSDGWEFLEWTGDINSTQTSVELVMDSDQDVTAVFDEILYDLTINITGIGTVSISPDIDEFEPGTLVELTAGPSEGWEFDQWEGDLTGTANPATITMESSKEITVLFIEQETEFSGGDGTSENPYRLSTAEELQEISEFPGSHFIQINNINAASTSGWNDGQGFSPIGSSSNPFTGSFNGNGFEISELTIDRDGNNHVGLFGFTANAQINNAGLVNVNIIGEDIVGGLVGTNNGQISNSYVTGSVSGDEMVGGLVGINNRQIISSHSEAAVFGDDEHIGGLAGINGSSGNIADSFASGNVESDDEYIGGLVGTNNGEISNSYATGSVTGDESVGGLVGSNSGSILSSFATGNVLGDDDMIGGLVGANRNNARIINSYATGSVSGDDEVGGLAGRNWPNGIIATSYAIGSVSGDDDTGGFIGWNQASLDSCYWDNQAANQSSGIGRGTQNGLTGLTTSEMTGSSAEDNMAGFNWNSVWRTSGSYPVHQ